MAPGSKTGSFDPATQQTPTLLRDLLPATVLCVVDSKEAVIVPGQQSNNNSRTKQTKQTNKKIKNIYVFFPSYLPSVSVTWQPSHVFTYILVLKLIYSLQEAGKQ